MLRVFAGGYAGLYHPRMTPRLARIFAALCLLVAALPVVSAGTAFARQDATPVSRAFVLEGEDRVFTGTPSGEQVLRLAGPTSPIRTFDPALARDVTAAFYGQLMFRGLTRLDDEMNPQPELAQRIEVSPDGLVYRFTLDERATFQDGKPITAQDVVGSITRALDPDTVGGNAELLGGPTYLSDILGADAVIANETDVLEGATVIDDRTLELRLTAPRSTFLMKLATAPGTVVDLAQAESDPEWWTRPNGSGPFAVSEFVDGERLVLSRFDGFVRGVPLLDRIEFRLGPSAANSFNLYQSGEIDLTGVPLSSLDRALDPNEGLEGELLVEPILATTYLAFRTDVAPSDDPKFREAVVRAFPRDKLAEVTFSGRWLPAEGILPPGIMGRDWPVPGSGYDLEAARAALAESAFPDGGAPPIQVYGASTLAAEALRDTIGDTLGIGVEVISLDWSDLAVKLALQDVPAYELTWIADFPDPETFLGSLFRTGSADNYSGYSNPEFDRLLDEAASTLDPDARAAIYAEAQDILMADHVVIPVLHEVRYTIHDDALKGLDPSPLGILNLDGVWMER